MKVLIVHNNYQSKFIGGEDVVFKRELIALKKHLSESNVLEYSVSNDDIKIFNLLFTIWFSKKHYREVYKLVKENNIDIVHVHNFYPILTPSVFKAAKNAGAKTIQTLHNYRWWCISGIFYRNECGVCELCAKKKFPFSGVKYRCYRGSYIQSLVTASALYLYKISKQIHFIDRFFVLTYFGRKKAIELGIDENKLILKPNFVKVEDINSSDKKDFIYVGKLDESKGVLELLKVWKQLDQKYILRLIGLGELNKDLGYFKSDNIIFLGKLENKTTLEKIAKSKYLIVPSLWYETFGLTIIEAMSLGVPVIGFNIGTRPEFIKNEVNGFLTEIKDLKNILEKAYSYHNYSVLSDNAKSFAKNYSEEEVINKQILIYKQIINNEL
jgi:glycosyltransferase involved in cell wall biosynthesis